MLNKQRLIGFIAGVLVVIFSFVVFGISADIQTPDIEKSDLTSSVAPEEEEDSYYGGDAYTGMQQAAAQSANNAVAVYNAVVAGNVALAKQAEIQANNIESAVTVVKTCFGFLLLAIGLLTMVKYSDAIFVLFDKKSSKIAQSETFTNFVYQPENVPSIDPQPEVISNIEPQPEVEPTPAVDETPAE